MAKYTRGRARRTRRWFVNIGDPIQLKHDNPNDKPLAKREAK